jgi:hypothetical protein
MQLASSNKTTMEIDVVGKDSVDGKNGYWFETTMTGATAGPPGGMLMKMLIVLDGANSYASKMVMQMGDRPPMEMAIPSSGGAAQKQPAEIKTLAEDVGSESITTPAGTFSCEHYRMKDGSGDTWVSEKVSPYGVCQASGQEHNDGPDEGGHRRQGQNHRHAAAFQSGVIRSTAAIRALLPIRTVGLFCGCMRQY